MKPDLDFATLIGSRICHDLISPIGAVNNGLELLSMSGVNAGPAEGPEMALINSSITSASARIRFFRIAFGAAGDQMMSAAEADAIVQGYYVGMRWQVTWCLEGPLPRPQVRLAFLALLCLETGMPFGGAITVEHAGPKWAAVGRAEKLGIDPDLWDILAGQKNADGLRPAHVQFGLLSEIANEAGQQIKSRIGDTEIRLEF